MWAPRICLFMWSWCLTLWLSSVKGFLQTSHVVAASWRLNSSSVKGSIPSSFVTTRPITRLSSITCSQNLSITFGPAHLQLLTLVYAVRIFFWTCNGILWMICVAVIIIPFQYLMAPKKPHPLFLAGNFVKLTGPLSPTRPANC